MRIEVDDGVVLVRADERSVAVLRVRHAVTSYVGHHTVLCSDAVQSLDSECGSQRGSSGKRLGEEPVDIGGKLRESPIESTAALAGLQSRFISSESIPGFCAVGHVICLPLRFPGSLFYR